MTEEEFKPAVKELFRRLGLEAKEIETCDAAQTPDFEVTGKVDKYTVELKIKGDDPEEIKAENQILSRGEIAGRHIPLNPRNRLSAIISDGIKQINEHDRTGKTYHVIWLHSAGQDPEEHETRFHATLFGTETLFSLNLLNGLICYYFYESAFYSFRNCLDGAILTRVNAKGLLVVQLCINTLSYRVGKFRQSELVQGLSGALCDPDKLHGLENGVFIADCSFDRKDSNKIIAYLQTKYGLEHLQTITMVKHIGKIQYKTD
jgi:hypothetical protein